MLLIKILFHEIINFNIFLFFKSFKNKLKFLKILYLFYF